MRRVENAPANPVQEAQWHQDGSRLYYHGASLRMLEYMSLSVGKTGDLAIPFISPPDFVKSKEYSHAWLEQMPKWLSQIRAVAAEQPYTKVNLFITAFGKRPEQLTQQHRFLKRMHRVDIYGGAQFTLSLTPEQLAEFRADDQYTIHLAIQRLKQDHRFLPEYYEAGQKAEEGIDSLTKAKNLVLEALRDIVRKDVEKKHGGIDVKIGGSRMITDGIDIQHGTPKYDQDIPRGGVIGRIPVRQSMLIGERKGKPHLVVHRPQGEYIKPLTKVLGIEGMDLETALLNPQIKPAQLAELLYERIKQTAPTDVFLHGDGVNKTFERLNTVREYFETFPEIQAIASLPPETLSMRLDALRIAVATMAEHSADSLKSKAKHTGALAKLTGEKIVAGVKATGSYIKENPKKIAKNALIGGGLATGAVGVGIGLSYGYDFVNEHSQDITQATRRVVESFLPDSSTPMRYPTTPEPTIIPPTASPTVEKIPSPVPSKTPDIPRPVQRENIVTLFPESLPEHGYRYGVESIGGMSAQGMYITDTSYELRNGSWVPDRTIAGEVNYPSDISKDIPHLVLSAQLTFPETYIKNRAFLFPIKDHSEVGSFMIVDAEGNPVPYKSYLLDNGLVQINIDDAFTGNKVQFRVGLVESKEGQVKARRRIASLNKGQLNPETLNKLPLTSIDALAHAIQTKFKYSLNPEGKERLKFAKTPEDRVNVLASFLGFHCDASSDEFVLLSTLVNSPTFYNKAFGYLQYGNTNFLDQYTFHAVAVGDTGRILDVTPNNPADDELTQNYIKDLGKDYTKPGEFDGGTIIQFPEQTPTPPPSPIPEKTLIPTPAPSETPTPPIFVEKSIPTHDKWYEAPDKKVEVVVKSDDNSEVVLGAIIGGSIVLAAAGSVGGTLLYRRRARRDHRDTYEEVHSIVDPAPYDTTKDISSDGVLPQEVIPTVPISEVVDGEEVPASIAVVASPVLLVEETNNAPETIDWSLFWKKATGLLSHASWGRPGSIFSPADVGNTISGDDIKRYFEEARFQRERILEVLSDPGALAVFTEAEKREFLKLTKHYFPQN